MAIDSVGLRRIMRQRFGIFHVKVLAADEMHEYAREPGIYIVNTQPHWKRGAHWVVFSNFGAKTKPEFFDSLGRSPYHYGFEINCHHNTWPIQSNNSKLCGEYALYYVVKHLRGQSLDKICNSFSRDVNVNDHDILSRLTALSL